KGIVVCSRIQDYQLLTERLALANALVLQPLTPEQVDTYLQSLGSKWNGLRSALSDNDLLRDLAQTPLLLNIMAVAYSGLSINQINAPSGSGGEQNPLFERYIARHLRMDAETAAYSQADIKRYLVWLAHNMVEHGQTLFRPDQIM